MRAGLQASGSSALPAAHCRTAAAEHGRSQRVGFQPPCGPSTSLCPPGGRVRVTSQKLTPAPPNSLLRPHTLPTPVRGGYPCYVPSVSRARRRPYSDSTFRDTQRPQQARWRLFFGDVRGPPPVPSWRRSWPGTCRLPPRSSVLLYRLLPSP